MTKIVTKIFNYGDKNESDWPSQFGTGEKGRFHIGEDGTCRRGSPPPKNKKFGEAPMYISDEINPRYSDATGKTYTSKSAYYREAKESGCVEVDKNYKAEGPDWKATAEEIRKDTEEAYYDVKYGRAELSEYEKHICKEENKKLFKKP